MTEERQKEIFSINLRRLIARSGKTQRQIADALNVNPPTFNMWACGKAIPALHMIVNLAECLQAPITELVFEKSDVESNTAQMHNLFMPYMSMDNLNIIAAYSNSDQWQKEAVCKLLNVKGD